MSDLASLQDLAALRKLHIDCLSISDAQPLQKLISSPSLEKLSAYNCWVAGVPEEFLGSDSELPALRAHFNDLGAEPSVLSDVKLIVLGNGRIGKTQICNRLRDLPFECDADSTHGITVATAPIPDRFGLFNIWDFGGQDIYYGTHSLFASSRAVFLIVWTPESDNSEETEHLGMRFRNRPMAWWLEFAALRGHGAPLIVVQNKIDVTPDQGDHKAVAARRGELDYCRSLPVSAETGQGMAGLREALSFASDVFNPPLIGSGRKAVIDRLRQLRVDEYRVLPLDAFEALCAEIGGISDIPQFLSFLNGAGEVFWREGLFEDALVLDQEWMLEGIYTVFDRENCYRLLEAMRGRFDREILAMLIWDEAGYSVTEQNLFLGYMLQSGIVFLYGEGQYIAPDLLPERPDDNLPLREFESEPQTWRFDYLPVALMRSVIVRVGAQAGLGCHYWRHGLYGYDAQTASEVLLEQKVEDDGSGEIKLATSGGRAKELATSMEQFLNEACARLDLSPISEVSAREMSSPSFERPPNRPISFFVSYAWANATCPECDEIVSDLCSRAKAKGTYIQRDKAEMKPGDRISEFMGQLVHGDRVIVILSEKYLRSQFCMTELYEIWLGSRGNDTEFLNRIRCFALPDAKIWTSEDRVAVARYWQDKYDNELGSLDLMGPNDRVRHLNMKKFAIHVGEILEAVVDVLQPKDVSELESYALN